MAQLKREKKGGNAVATTARVSPVVNMQGDTLTVVQEEEGDDRATAAAAEATVAALRRQLEDERARSRSLLARLARHEEQVQWLNSPFSFQNISHRDLVHFCRRPRASGSWPSSSRAW